MESSLDADDFKGQIKVTRGHPKSNGLLLLCGLESWWMESSSDVKYFEGKFAVIVGHLRSNRLSLLY